MSCISGSGYPCSSTCRRSSFDDLRRTHTNRSRVQRLLRWPHEPFLDEIHEFYLDSTHRRISTTLHLTHSKVFLKSLMDVFVDPSSSLCRLTLTSLDYLRLVLVTIHCCRWFLFIHFTHMSSCSTAVTIYYMRDLGIPTKPHIMSKCWWRTPSSRSHSPRCCSFVLKCSEKEQSSASGHRRWWWREWRTLDHN